MPEVSLVLLAVSFVFETAGSVFSFVFRVVCCWTPQITSRFPGAAMKACGWKIEEIQELGAAFARETGGKIGAKKSHNLFGCTRVWCSCACCYLSLTTPHRLPSLELLQDTRPLTPKCNTKLEPQPQSTTATPHHTLTPTNSHPTTHTYTHKQLLECIGAAQGRLQVWRVCDDWRVACGV